MSLNKVMIIGNLGKDPEVRSFPTGGRVANFSVATSQTWRDKQSGERRERTEWHRVAVYNDKTIDFIQKYMGKGSQVYIEGMLETRKWTDQSGNERYTTEISVRPYSGEVKLLGRRGNGSGNDEARNDSAGTPAANPAPAGGGAIEDDEIPF